jgi:hypothetical protein
VVAGGGWRRSGSKVTGRGGLARSRINKRTVVSPVVFIWERLYEATAGWQ